MIIKEAIEWKPSKALTAMMDGLLEQLDAKDFKVNMSTFGEVDDGMCCGCAATCAILKLCWDPDECSKADFVSYRYGAKAYGPDGLAANRDIVSFEGAIDDARKGMLGSLFRYCGIPTEDLPPEFLVRLLWLQNDNVRESEAEVRELIRELEEAGY